MTKVTLHGNLGRELGENWDLMVRQPREAIAAIEANTGRLYAYLRNHKETEYRVIVNGRWAGATPEELYLEGEILTIDVVPVPAGSAGLWQIIIGVVLIIVGIVIIVASGGAGTPGVVSLWSTLAPYIIGVGISLTLGGIAQMLAPSPKLGASPLARSFTPTNTQLQTGEQKNSSNGITSYLFNGAINATSQGNPVQIIYGEMIVGSQTVSLAITGTSVDQTVLGSHRAPPADEAFFDLAVWGRLEADARGLNVPSQRSVQLARVTAIPALRTVFGLPAMFPVGDPAAGRTIMVGNSNLPRRTVRNYLSVISFLFSNNPRGITFREAVDLYQVLALTSLADLPRSSWKQVVLALALHYSPEP